MSILKIVPGKDYQVLMDYLSDPGVVLLPESVLAGFSPEIQRKFRRMDQPRSTMTSAASLTSMWM